MIPFLPPELLRAILSNLSIPSDLSRSCLTSKTFLSIARPLLYNQVEFRISENLGTGPVDWAEKRSHIEAISHKLLVLLQRKPCFAPLVRKVTIRQATPRCICFETYTTYETTPAMLLQQVVAMLPEVKVVVLDNLFRRDDADRFVHDFQHPEHSHQRSVCRATPPVYWLVTGKSRSPETISGAYERVCWIPSSPSEENLHFARILEASQITLKQLRIPLGRATSLASFQFLEQLSLRLPFQSPSITIQKLTRTISELPSLRTLHLHVSTRQADCSKVLQARLLAKSLPPSLTHLYLPFKLTSGDLLPFLRDLPARSNLKRFNCLSETEEMEGVVEGFSKRGIRLSIDEDWDIQW